LTHTETGCTALEANIKGYGQLNNVVREVRLYVDTGETISPARWKQELNHMKWWGKGIHFLHAAKGDTIIGDV
jgi:hypothetical protein